MNYTLDQLRALDAIDRTGSFADAAKTLHKVPSAVSYLVKELESGLGVAIFDRTRRKATLTPQGRTVLTAARAPQSAFPIRHQRSVGGESLVSVSGASVRSLVAGQLDR